MKEKIIKVVEEDMKKGIEQVYIDVKLLKEMGFENEVDEALIVLAMSYKKMYDITEDQLRIAEYELSR